ncbi:MAG TPA: hypothetical protein VL095_08525 [Flavisolibacter sp.]|nr:hypothetical protein [Flavisolibacter sp.]
MWKRWWPSLHSFSFDGYTFSLATSFSDGAEIKMTKGSTTYHTQIRTIAIGSDSTTVQWLVTYASSKNPVQRVQQAKSALKIKSDLDELLQHLKNFAEKTENIYGFNIRRTTFTDTLLAAKKFAGKEYPSLTEIYKTIHQVRQTLSSQGIVTTGYPMLNVNRKDSALYETMIAIPVNKKPLPQHTVFFTRMISMKDKFLFTEVTGGPGTIQNAHGAINQYMNDHSLSAPAIPFEVLITDRSQEADTSKWKTLVYHPSM